MPPPLPNDPSSNDSCQHWGRSWVTTSHHFWRSTKKNRMWNQPFVSACNRGHLE